MTDFADPSAGGDKLPLAELKGALAIFDVREYVEEIHTAFGESSAVRCSVTIVDGPMAGKVWGDTLIFPRVLQGALRPNVGRKVLGRIAQGPAKPGQSPPWILEAATDADKAAATALLVNNAAAAAAEEPF